MQSGYGEYYVKASASCVDSDVNSIEMYNVSYDQLQYLFVSVNSTRILMILQFKINILSKNRI